MTRLYLGCPGRKVEAMDHEEYESDFGYDMYDTEFDDQEPSELEPIEEADGECPEDDEFEVDDCEYEGDECEPDEMTYEPVVDPYEF